MYPVLLFGSLAVAAAVLWAIRLERRHLRLMLALAVTSVAAGFLALSMGLINIFRYVQHVPPNEQVRMVTLGISESLRPLALALTLDVITGIIAAIAAFRPRPERASSLEAG
jgi:hypothetical protein